MMELARQTIRRPMTNEWFSTSHTEFLTLEKKVTRFLKKGKCILWYLLVFAKNDVLVDSTNRTLKMACFSTFNCYMD